MTHTNNSIAPFLNCVTYTSTEERLDVVEVLVSDIQLRQGLWEEHLRAMPDLGRLARKLQRGKGTLQV